MDRNLCTALHGLPQQVSLSARRAWIEIIGGPIAIVVAASRSPQGERG